MGDPNKSRGIGFFFKNKLKLRRDVYSGPKSTSVSSYFELNVFKKA